MGDCNLDAEVTIDEIVKMIAISLGDADLSQCEAGDRDGDGAITIDEVIAATVAALNLCAADLIPLDVEALPCPGGCGPQRLRICVINAGPLGAQGFEVALNTEPSGSFSGLAAGALDCIETNDNFGGVGAEETVTIDSENTVPEIREDNNSIAFPRPNPTACDMICESPAGG